MPAPRGAGKLAAALDWFQVDPRDRIAADLGCSVGGFTGEMLRRGARRVYAVDTGHGMLAQELRLDPRVVVRERTNALHLELPEPVSLVVIDVSWTPQRRILPAAWRLLAGGGDILTLVKPQYEAPRGATRRGVLPEARAAEVLEDVCSRLEVLGFPVQDRFLSPVPGASGNREYFLWLRRSLSPRGGGPPAPPGSSRSG
jgi:23S rRNA (cytidine1920-2'-O)/16S rRNA (cytidine1409-2'-O)-methyltransferase